MFFCCSFVRLFPIKESPANSKRFLFLSYRLASTSSSTLSSLAGSSHWPQAARTRRSSESASMSSSCPSASSSHRKTTARQLWPRHRCVCVCVSVPLYASLSASVCVVWKCVSCCPLAHLRCVMFPFSRSPVIAVVIGAKLAVIEFCAARGAGVAKGISVAASPFSSGRSAQRGTCLHWFQTKPKQTS